MIVTDWNDIYNLYERDHIAESRKDAVRIAINAGIDMAMVPLDRDFCVYLRELVEEGLVSERRIDDAVRRILRLKMRIGLFEEPFPDTSKFDRFASDEFAAVALQAAEESEVLLKNDGGLLPLPKSARILLPMPIPCAVSTAAGLTPGRVSVAMSLQIVTIRFTRPWRVNSIMLPGFQA